MKRRAVPRVENMLRLRASYPLFNIDRELIHVKTIARFILTSGAMLLLSSALLAKPHAWTEDFDSALKQAQKQNRPVLVDVYATWCTFCRKLRDEVYPTTQVRKETDRFVTVRVDGEKHPHFMERYGITGFPTILFLDQNGILIERLTGFQEAPRLARILRDVYGRRDQETKMLARLKRNPESVQARYEAGVYFYEKGERERARELFLEGWNLAVHDSGTNRRDCLYNAAVTSMDLRDYVSAISYWNIYLQVYAGNRDESAYARYFRGISYKYMGRHDLARSDLEFASTTLRDQRDREAAERVLATLPAS